MQVMLKLLAVFAALVTAGCQVGPGGGMVDTVKSYYDVGAPAALPDGTLVLVHGPALRGYSADFELKWQQPVRPAAWDEIPLVAGGQIYLFSGDGRNDGREESRICALSAFSLDGTPLWSVPLPGIPKQMVADEAGDIYVAVSSPYSSGSGDINLELPTANPPDAGWIVKVSPAGEVRWTFDDLRRVKAGPLLTPQGDVVAADATALVALSGDGSELFRFAVAQDAESDFTALACGAALYYANADVLCALSYGGKELWRIKLDEKAHSLAVTAERVHVSLAGGNLLALSLEGEELWRGPQGFDAAFTLLPAEDGSVYADSYEYYGGRSHGFLNKFSADGALLWRYERYSFSPHSLGPDGRLYTPAQVETGPWESEPQLLALSPDGIVAARLLPDAFYSFIVPTSGLD